MSVRRIRISGQLLDSFLRDSELWASSLPDDVHVVGVADADDDRVVVVTDAHRGIRPGSFALLVESKEFPAIAEGQLVPFIAATFRRKLAR